MEPRLVLFDIDGTLVDTAGAGRRAIVQAFHEVFGNDGAEEVAARVPFAGMTDLQIFASLAAGLGVADELFARSTERLHTTYLGALRSEMARDDPRRRILPGVVELLEALQTRADVQLGLLTGNLERGARIKLEPFGLNPFFPGGGFGSDHPQRRVVARLAHQKLSRIAGTRFDSAHVYVIGDTENDVDCARANGFRAVAVASGWGDREAMRRLEPDALLDDLGDLQRSLAVLGVG